MNMTKIQNLIRVLIGLLAFVLVFHVLILFQIIPFNMVWGGRLQSEQEMYWFESISTFLNLLLIWALSLKAKGDQRKSIDIILWIFFILFSFNTVGNLFAHSDFEKYFSILTFIFAVVLFNILWKKKD